MCCRKIVNCSNNHGVRIMKRRHVLHLILSVVVAMLIGLGGTSLGLALTLHEAKTEGLLGELSNGYLGIVNPPASQEVTDLMNEINQKRRERYQDIARRNKTKLEAVEALAGKTAIKKTKLGQYIKTPSTGWNKK